MPKRTRPQADLCIMNDSTGVLLASHALLAATFFRRFVGLIGRDELRLGEGLVLAPCQAVHTMFMSFPIDLIFLDRSGGVMLVMSDVTPGRRSPVMRDAFYVVELPAGVIRNTGTQKGDRIMMMWNDNRGRALH